MSRGLRVFMAALAAVTVLAVGTTPALAFQDEGLAAQEKQTPVLLDAFLLRPVGLAMTAVGAAAFVPAGAITALTRPRDIGKPFRLLVANPFRYTFMDPLGEH